MAGDYESPDEYVRDLIRRDKAAADDRSFARVQAQLQAAFATADGDYREVDADEIRRQVDASGG